MGIILCSMILESPGVIPVLEQVPGIRAFFTTRQGGTSTGHYASLNLSQTSGDDPDAVKKNWNLLLRSQGLEDKMLVLPRLCHGYGMQEIRADSGTSPENIDAVYTREPGRILAVTLGDCLGILIADPETRCIAAVHAGWRGSRENILGWTLEKLFSSGHCLPESTFIALSPCLSTRMLEISGDIASTLPPLHVERGQNRFFFDLQGCNRSQAVAAGVLTDHISAVNACTRTDAERFFSYRRDGAASGRMTACISLL